MNNVEIPTPSDCTVSIFDIYEGTDRDSTGTIHLDYIATKNKLECTWSYLSQDELKSLLSAISQISFKVTYTSPATGESVTLDMYKGDRTIPILDVIEGETRYKDFKVNFIEL
nr:DUF6711 family protein [uncultured Cellulosilyticum sp.]